VNTAVYRLETTDGVFFLKLRKGDFREANIELAGFLADQGIREIIPPVRGRDGKHWADLGVGGYSMVLYPFIHGEDGYARALTERQWVEFGRALRAIHDSQPPEDLLRQIPRETYPDTWREIVRQAQREVDQKETADPAAAKFAAGMRRWKTEIDHMTWRAEELARELREVEGERVVCHSDIHPGNLLISDAGEVYIVDWDAPILARRERDLMYIGAGIANFGQSEAQQRLFTQGYGDVTIDRRAMAYYRYERVVEDIAAFAQQLLWSDTGGEDREQAVRWFESNFQPGQEYEIARETDG
jgi:spectinomycin phosphotransferase